VQQQRACGISRASSAYPCRSGHGPRLTHTCDPDSDAFVRIRQSRLARQPAPTPCLQVPDRREAAATRRSATRLDWRGARGDNARMRGIFVTGTDTGVGKTRVATAIAHALTARGIRVHARKPVESGVDARTGPADAQALHEAAGAHETLERVCPLRLSAPLSPERAARLEGIALELDRLVASALDGVDDDGFVLVEGAGGLLSPIARDALNADLAQALRLPVLIVAADRLGTLNHTLLTVDAVRVRGLDVAGVVLNAPTAADTEAMDNAGELTRWLGHDVLRLPHGGASRGAAWPDEGALLAPLLDRLVGVAR
jgi:dethiobiotin synthetase